MSEGIIMRVFRSYTYQDGTKKKSVYINLYIPSTTDEDWMNKSQISSIEPVWCEDLDEAIQLTKKILSGQIGKK